MLGKKVLYPGGGYLVEIKSIKNSVSFKVFIIASLILVLLIPASMIRSLIFERSMRRYEVVNEITEKWGQKQIVAGPLLTIPYEEFYEDDEGILKKRTKYANFLPDVLNIKGSISPDIRYRSIYKTVVYNSNLSLEGEFSYPEIDKLNISTENMKWDEAFISVGISDMVGIRDKITIDWNGNKLDAAPGTKNRQVFNSGIHVDVPLQNVLKNNFYMDINLNGSQSLNFYPLGEVTNVEIGSSWENPSFQGNFLPVERDITEEGFLAKWQVFNLNRNYPQQWLDVDNNSIKHSLNQSAFGVDLILPVDLYQKTTRAVKYAVMFIVMTFLVYFFIEILNTYNIHPIQYLLVGFALIVFYLLLISLSEHIYFWYAYIIASISTIILISLFSASIIKEKKVAYLMAGILSILYIFLYILLESQDYALLLGSIGVFLILSFIMYLTRNIDWYSINLDK